MTRRLFQDDGDTTGHGVTHIRRPNRRAAPDVTTMVTALSATLRRRRYWKSVADPVLWAQRSCSACIGSDRKNWFQQIINILTRAPISSSWPTARTKKKQCKLAECLCASWTYTYMCHMVGEIINDLRARRQTTEANRGRAVRSSVLNMESRWEICRTQQLLDNLIGYC